MISFTVEGKPEPQARPRVGRNRATGRPVLIDPPKCVMWKRLVRYQAQRQMLVSRVYGPMEGPVAISIYIFTDPPESWSRKKRKSALEGAVKPASRPDWDNLAKAVCDALNGLVWFDDAQITQAHVIKRYAGKPGVAITVRPDGDGEGR